MCAHMCLLVRENVIDPLGHSVCTQYTHIPVLSSDTIYRDNLLREEVSRILHSTLLSK
jgi:hypothetical protein